MFGLDPDNVIDRIRREGKPVLMPTLRQAVITGTLGFLIVTVAAFSLWAFGGRTLSRAFTPAGFYAAIAVVMFAGGAFVFKPLIIGRNLGRFAALFALGFVLFSVAWIVGYMTRAPYRLGEWAGVLIGPVLLAGTLCIGFGARDQFKRCAVILAISHFAAYLIADRLFTLEALQNQLGMLVWGVVYGAGFGAGISAVLHHCQQEIRQRLSPPE